jgi:hypothetical protein
MAKRNFFPTGTKSSTLVFPDSELAKRCGATAPAARLAAESRMNLRRVKSGLFWESAFIMNSRELFLRHLIYLRGQPVDST